jgi:hypothetical protein
MNKAVYCDNCVAKFEIAKEKIYSWLMNLEDLCAFTIWV